MKRIALLLTLLAGLAFAQTPSLSLSDQTLDGNTLTIDSVTLAQDGFVVVHATNPDGSLVLTPPLGLTYLAAGTHENVAVELDGDLLAEYGYGPPATMGMDDDAMGDDGMDHDMGDMGMTGDRAVAPMLHVDDGDMTYEFPDGPDTPVTVDGDVVMGMVAVSFGPSLTTFDQALSGGMITVDTVVAEQDGFVVVHALDMNGDAVLTPPLGLAHVTAGVSRYVTIELDPALLTEYGYDAGPKAVVPMLHIDDGDMTYEFPDGPDTPVVVGDGPLVSPLELTVAMTGMDMGPAAIGVSGMETLDVGMDGLSVTLSSVTLTQPGFVVLHATDMAGELVVLPVLGASAALPAGTHEDVVVPIAADQVPQVGDTVVAMVHVDDGNGVYEFPDSDAPFVQDGSPLVTSLELH